MRKLSFGINLVVSECGFSYIDQLQEQVLAWYGDFKDKFKDEIGRKVQRAFPGSPDLYTSRNDDVTASDNNIRNSDTQLMNNPSCCHANAAAVAALEAKVERLTARIRALEQTNALSLKHTDIAF